MQIRQTGQSIPVSKVETDRREEVSKIKPLGSNKIPDSFETGKAASENQSNTSSAEPGKQAGQITGGILIKQMTQARLADAGIKLANPSATENTGTRDLTDIQQGQVVATSPQVNTKGNPRTPDATTDSGPRVPEGAYTGDARSNMEKNKGALADFFAQNNIDVPSSGNGVDASDFGVGQGVDLGNGFNTDQGPGDPMDNVNDQFARRDYLNGVGNAGNRLSSQMQDALQGSDGANLGHGEGMVSFQGEGETYTRQNPDGTSTTVWDAGDTKGDRSGKRHTEVTERQWGRVATTDASNIDKDGNHVERHSEVYIHNVGFTDYTEKTSTTDKNGNTTTKEESGTTNRDGSSKSKVTTTTIDSNGNVTSTTVTTTTTDKNGYGTSTTSTTKDGKTTTTTTTTKPSASMPKGENYVDPEALKKMKEMDGMLKNLGMDGIWNIQRGPKNQGKGPDYGPEPVGTSVEDAGNGSLFSQFGKDGLVGNPNQQNHDGAGSSNFGGLPGSTNSDPLEGSNYNGVTRDEEVDVSVQTGIKENVAEDDEEKRKLIKNPDVKLATTLPHSKKF